MAMSDTVLQVVFGHPSHRRTRTPYHDTFATTAPMVGALLLAAAMGLWLPAGADAMLRSAASLVEGRP